MTINIEDEDGDKKPKPRRERKMLLIQENEKTRIGKAEGVDGITSEMLKCGGTVLLARLIELFTVCAGIVNVPNDWKNTTIVPLYQGRVPARPIQCDDYHVFSVSREAELLPATL
uniref:Uncharacterized protein n=1 Tax=Timema tahoe TaxID=61484 RepID=A0A7R9IIP4_9NEOP|nr:unnamed protein product [Timema tahoe]